MIYVALIPTGKTRRIWLAGDPTGSHLEHTGAEGLAHSHQRLLQDISGPGQTYVTYLDRGNERSSCSFSTSRLFPTAKDAWLWMNRWARASSEWPHPLEGTLIERCFLDGFWAEEIFAKAIMQKPVMKFEGCTVRLNYSIFFTSSSAGASGHRSYLVAEGVSDICRLLDGRSRHLTADSIVPIP